MVPDGWRRVALGDVAVRVTRRNTTKNDNVLTISARDGLVGQEEYFNKRVASRDVANYFNLKRGEFAYSKSFSQGYPAGAIKRLVRHDEGVVSPLYMCFALPDGNGVFPDFAARYLESDAFYRPLRAIAKQGARAHGLLNVRPEDFFSIAILLPPIDEQHRIATVLQAADDAVFAAEAVSDQTEKVKRGLVAQLLTSTDWPTHKVSEVGDSQLGQQKHPKFAEGTNVRPYLRVANVLDGRIDFSDLNEMHFPERDLKKFELRDGDILLNEGQSTHLVGRSAVYRGEVPGICVQKTLLRYRPGPLLLAEFVQCVFQHWLHTRVFASIAVQTTSMAHLTAVRFNQMRIPVPPLKDQRRILEVASAAQTAPETLAAVRAVRAALTSDLLTGRVRRPA